MTEKAPSRASVPPQEIVGSWTIGHCDYVGAQDRGQRAEVITPRVVQDDRGWLRLAR